MKIHHKTFCIVVARKVSGNQRKKGLKIKSQLGVLWQMIFFEDILQLMLILRVTEWREETVQFLVYNFGIRKYRGTLRGS